MASENPKDWEKEYRKHPAYGQVQISRITGGAKLFGTHVQTTNMFALRICRSEVRDNEFGSQHYANREQLIEVLLSPAQFVELMTSLNSGTGIPCTIQRLHMKSVEEIPDDEQTGTVKARKMFKDKIRDYFKTNLSRSINEAEDLLNKKRITKGDVQGILKELYFLKQNMESNFPWYLDQIQEASDKIVSSAKVEVEAFVSTVIQKAGLEAIAKGHFPKLLSENGEK